MIPWFVVTLVTAIASLFGRDVYVRAVSDGFGAERIYLVRRPPGSQRLLKLKPYRGGLIVEGDRLPCPCGETGCLSRTHASFTRPMGQLATQ